MAPRVENSRIVAQPGEAKERWIGSGKPLHDSALSPVWGNAFDQEACSKGIVSDKGQDEDNRIVFEMALGQVPRSPREGPQRAAILTNPSSICQSEKLRSIRDLDSSCNLAVKVSLNWPRFLQAKECFCRRRAAHCSVHGRQTRARD